MRVFIDTNILISAALFPGSMPDLAYTKAVSAPNEAISFILFLSDTPQRFAVSATER